MLVIGYSRLGKRVADIIGAVALLPLLTILTPIVAVAVKLDDGGPVFYRSTRLGRGQLEFGMYKFRTMSVGAPDLRNPDGTTVSSRNDVRVTTVGRFLRHSSIDEVPQILNVLKGEMSFIGPRPSPLGNTAQYPRWYFEKFSVRPGITGYSQSLRRNASSMAQRQRDDIRYVRSVSLCLDIKILLWTAVSVLARRNINRSE